MIVTDVVTRCFSPGVASRVDILAFFDAQLSSDVLAFVYRDVEPGLCLRRGGIRQPFVAYSSVVDEGSPLAVCGVSGHDDGHFYGILSCYHSVFVHHDLRTRHRPLRSI